MAVSIEVAELLDKVPRPPGQVIPPGIEEARIVAFQERTGITLPEELVCWLRFTNGPLVGPGGIFGVRPVPEVVDIEFYYGLHSSWKEKKWIPVAGDGCGNFYLMATNDDYGHGRPIFFVDTHEDPDEPCYLVASDLWHFFSFLLRKELGETGWPFNKEIVVGNDPAIENYRDIPYPW